MNIKYITDREIISALNYKIEVKEDMLKNAPDNSFSRACRDSLNRLKEAREILKEVFWQGD